MKLKFKHFSPAIVLGVICLVVATLLAVINHFTAPVIERNELYAKTASLREVFGGDESGAEFGEPLAKLPEGTPSTVKEIYEEKNGMGYAMVIVIPKGFESEINLTVGVGSDGKIKGVVITKYEDSLGKDDMMNKVGGFKGKDASDYADVSLVSGATYSSNAVKAAIGDALAAAELAMAEKAASVSLTSEESTGAYIPTETEMVEWAKTVLAGANNFEAMDISAAGLASGTKIYKETSGKGYLVYGECFNPYAPASPEATFVFTMNADCVITGFKLYYWSLSPSYQEDVQIYIDHPEVQRFIESFDGANKMNFDLKVDHVTLATVTSERIEAAVMEALNYLDDTHESEIKTYKAIGTVIFFLAIAGFGVAIYFERRRRV